MKTTTRASVVAENAKLRARLAEAEEIFRAVRAGEVDALIIDGPEGQRIFTLQGVDGESNRFRGEILSQVGDAVCAVDLDQHVTFLNAAAERLYGLTAAEALGRELTELYCSRPGSLNVGLDLKATIREGGAWQAEHVLLTHDGRELQVESHGTCLLDKAGQMAGMLFVTRDITTRKQAEALLRQSEERLRSLSGELEQEVEARTHELTQSQAHLRALAAELNVTEQRERKRLAGELHDYLAQLLVLCRLNLGQAKRIGLPQKADDIIRETEDVLNQALQYSRSLMAELYPPVLLEHGLPAALSWLGEQMRQRGLLVTVEASGGSWTLPEESAMLLFQSVRELLMNVLKHAGSNEVTVRLDQSEEKLRIHVHDDGVGFHTAASPANSTSMSSGFGLLSIRERMIALGGWFDLQSAPGRGTNATLVLPLAKVRREAPAPPLAQDAALPVPFVPIGDPVSSTVIRVLLVDDHAMVRQGLRTMLDGYTDIEVVGEAWNGEEALTLVERLRPGIVLMDINMPRMNGIEATAKITARFPSIIVIGLSVHADKVNELAMREAGAAALLTKEAAVEELYRAVKAAMDFVAIRKNRTGSSSINPATHRGTSDGDNNSTD